MILDYADCFSEDKGSIQKQIKEIFFESAFRKNFSSDEEKNLFYQKWTDYYFLNLHQASDVFVSADVDAHTDKDMDKGRAAKLGILGYLMGCRDSQLALNFYKNTIPSYALFSDLFLEFECHLHINFSAQARGLGLGSELVEHYCSYVNYEKSKSKALHSGVHIVTSPHAPNVEFYRKNKFSIEIERSFKGISYLFMGRKF